MLREALTPQRQPQRSATRQRYGLRYLQTLKLSWPLLALPPILLVLVAAALMVQGVGQLITSNGTRWERAQQHAVLQLVRYHGSCSPADHAAYLADMRVLKAFEQARAAVLGPVVDAAAARAGYEEIGMPPWEARLLVALLPHLQAFPLQRASGEIWNQANAVAREIDQHASRLHQIIQQGCPAATHSALALAPVYEAADRLRPLRLAFDAAASQVRWRLSLMVLAVMIGLALPITLAGYLLTARLQRRAAAATAALAISQRRLQQALTGSGYGLWDLPVNGGTVLCSGTMMALLGHADREQELESEEFQALVHPDDRAGFAQLLQARAADEQRLDIELRLRGKGGGHRWFKLAGQIVRVRQGEPQRIVGSVSDVTERHDMQQAIQQELALRRGVLQAMRGTLARMLAVDEPPVVAQSPSAADTQDEVHFTTQALVSVGAQLRASNEQLQAVLSLSPDGFVSFDEQERLSLASRAVETLTGLPAEPLEGLSAPAFFARLHALCVPETPMPGLQTLHAHASGEPVMLELATQPPRTLSLELREGLHPVARHVLCLRDVTQQRQVERLKSEFITLAAHELRTPMTVIFGYAEMLMRRPLNEDKRRDLHTIIHKQSRLMVSILDDLTDLGRLEARQGLALQRVEVDLGSLLRATAAALPLPEGRQPPQWLGADQAPEARMDGDETHLIRAFNNVLNNAYRYSPDGGAVDISLTRHTTASGAEEACIRIADHGIGMTPEQLARVGERFYRADASGHIPGTGLGMSIVQEIVKLHGGTVQLHSESGRGTQVDICLPLRAAAGAGQDPATRA